MDDTQRIEALLAAIQEHGNPVVRAAAVDLVRALLEVHRAGLAAILDTLTEQGEPGRAMMASFIRHDLISRLLLLHGLHPIDLDTRIRQSLNQLDPRLRAIGAEVRLEHSAHDRVRLRVTGDAPDVRTMLEQAILEAAPEVTAVEFVDGDARATRLPLPLLRQ